MKFELFYLFIYYYVFKKKTKKIDEDAHLRTAVDELDNSLYVMAFWLVESLFKRFPVESFSCINELCNTIMQSK